MLFYSFYLTVSIQFFLFLSIYFILYLFLMHLNFFHNSMFNLFLIDSVFFLYDQTINRMFVSTVYIHHLLKRHFPGQIFDHRYYSNLERYWVICLIFSSFYFRIFLCRIYEFCVDVFMEVFVYILFTSASDIKFIFCFTLIKFGTVFKAFGIILTLELTNIYVILRRWLRKASMDEIGYRVYIILYVDARRMDETF